MTSLQYQALLLVELDKAMGNFLFHALSSD